MYVIDMSQNRGRLIRQGPDYRGSTVIRNKRRERSPKFPIIKFFF